MVSLRASPVPTGVSLPSNKILVVFKGTSYVGTGEGITVAGVGTPSLSLPTPVTLRVGTNCGMLVGVDVGIGVLVGMDVGVKVCVGVGLGPGVGECASVDVDVEVAVGTISLEGSAEGVAVTSTLATTARVGMALVGGKACALIRR